MWPAHPSRPLALFIREKKPQNPNYQGPRQTEPITSGILCRGEIPVAPSRAGLLLTPWLEYGELEREPSAQVLSFSHQTGESEIKVSVEPPVWTG